jgi:hypothetical protein
MHKSKRHVIYKASRRAAGERARVTPAKPGPQPTITRLAGDVELIAPPGCCASVVLKLVGRDDGHRYYSWWAVVGRNGMDKLSVPYKFTGEDTIRMDLPEGVSLSAASLQPFLTAYLAGEGNEPPDTPIIRD